ncbi:MAG: hypothetical protein ACM3L5_00650 [Candidatus Saccharibacteria bacterium]
MVGVDTKTLIAEASSEGGEAFLTIGRWKGMRVGVGVRDPHAFFVEVLVPLFPNEDVDLNWIEEALKVLRWLDSHGYRLSCRDDRAVSGEKNIRENEVESEVAAALQVAGPAT